MLVYFVCFTSFPPSDHIQSTERTSTYPTVLTIVDFDGTSILSLHIGDQRRKDWLLRTYRGKEKTMAQDRRVAGDHSHDDFWGRESVLEVSGVPAYLKRCREEKS